MASMSLLRRLVERFRREPDPLAAAQNPAVGQAERPYDLVLVAVVLALIGLGTVEIYSATAADALAHYHDAAHFLERQLGYLAVGGLALWAGARLDYRRLAAWTVPLLFVAIVLLALALFAPARNGARRWIPL